MRTQKKKGEPQRCNSECRRRNPTDIAGTAGEEEKEE